MKGAAGAVHVAAAHGADRVKESAAIWARAKACRDQDAEPATIEETMPGIWRRLSIDGASLFLARRDGHPVGFLLVAPRARTLEVFYLAVDPDVWGCGVGSLLLLSAEDHAREIGRETLELWVINDNERAIGVYERSGWLGTDEVKRDTSSGRLGDVSSGMFTGCNTLRRHRLTRAPTLNGPSPVWGAASRLSRATVSGGIVLSWCRRKAG